MGLGCCKINNNFNSGFTDENLIELINDGNNELVGTLCAKYSPLCSLLSKRFASSTKLEADDLFQDGMIGFLDAIRRFNTHKNIPFRYYARHCMTSKMLNTIESSKSAKRNPTFENIFLEEDAYEDPFGATEDIVISQDHVNSIWQQITSLLSKNEYEIFRLYLGGFSYSQIALHLQISSKSVDNALFRVRTKLRAGLIF